MVVAADKAKEQELKARTREVITTKQEQVHVTHEQVKMVFWYEIVAAVDISVNPDSAVYRERCCFVGNMVVSLGTRYQSLLESPDASLV